MWMLWMCTRCWIHLSRLLREPCTCAQTQRSDLGNGFFSVAWLKAWLEFCVRIWTWRGCAIPGICTGSSSTTRWVVFPELTPLPIDWMNRVRETAAHSVNSTSMHGRHLKSVRFFVTRQDGDPCIVVLRQALGPHKLMVATVSRIRKCGNFVSTRYFLLLLPCTGAVHYTFLWKRSC